MRNWEIKNKDFKNNNIVDQIYKQKGINDFHKLFDLNENNLHDPFLLKDMTKAVDRIKQAIAHNEKILIYGDYDVDGITSTYILYKTLLDLNADAYFHIPSRFYDGYGLNDSKTLSIIEDNIKLVITVDNGIKSFNEAKTFKEHGIDLIITDHHEIDKTLPDAFAIIHTNLSDYPFKPLAGVGVAYKLVEALIGVEAYKYLDAVALGTIADMMPLIEENRAIVNVGLERLKTTKNIGLKKLIEFLDITMPSVSDVQFKIAPRINACGRMKSADIAVNLFMAKTSEEAVKLISTIENINNERKILSNRLYEESLNLLDEKSHTIVIKSKSFHEGILGIVSSKLANETNKVSVVFKEEELTLKGSIRNYGEVDLINVLNQISDILIRFGGHQNAAGLEIKVEDFDEFRRRFNDLIPKDIRPKKLFAEGIVNIHTLNINEIVDLDQYDLKDALFVFENLYIKSKYLIKNLHSKLTLSNNVEAIMFNNSKLNSDLLLSNKISLIGKLDTNFYRGITKKIILIDDYKIL
ncbi:MAG: single-stranded-DNA-specific exonuclease RecJ [Candidatus Izemoplasma sp.]